MKNRKVEIKSRKTSNNTNKVGIKSREKAGKSGTRGKLRTVVSTQSWLPVRDISRGVIVTKDGRFVKLMEFTPINFSLRSAGEQNTIISQFAGALRSMPETVQFKVFSRRSNPEKYTRALERVRKEESDPGCLGLIDDQIDLIRSTSENQGITRRFFLSFEYSEQKGLSRRPSFRRVASEMGREASQIASALSACGNDLVSGDSEEYILGALYDIASRAQSAVIPFEDRRERVLSACGAGYGERPVIPVNDFIAPGRVDTAQSHRYMVVDGMYYMFCYLPSSAYPARALGGWMSLLINMGEGVDVDLFFHKEDVAASQRKIQYRLRSNKVKLKGTDDTSQDYDDLESAISAGYHLKQGLANNDDFCYMGILITITAGSPEELNYRYTRIRNHCVRNSMKLRQCLYCQESAFISALPLCRYDEGIWRKSRRNLLSSSLASAYPFVSYELTDEGGVLLGANHDNGSLVFINLFDTRKYNNANAAILGSSGAGKTYTLQCLALRMRQQQIQVFIIAPLKGMEFERACRAVGGTFVRIAPGSGNNINIMEIRKKDSPEENLLRTDMEENSVLLQKVQQLHAFFSLLVKDLTPEEVQILDESLLVTYDRFGITADNGSLEDPENPEAYRKMPVLRDLWDVLGEKEGAGRLRSFLTRYVSGSARSFSGPTNVNLDNKYVVLDVSTLTDEMLPIGMFIALDYVWDKARENRTAKKCIFVDETWKLVGTDSSPQAAKFVLEIFKVIRGYGGSAIAATQDLNDFFALDGGVYGQGIINNAKTKLLMKTEPREAETVASVMDLTEAETEEIRKLQRGTCLLASNTNHVFIDVRASRAEHSLITTDARELREIALAEGKQREGGLSGAVH